MTQQDLIIHRGNSPYNRPTPIEQVEYYIGAGFRKIEIDIYALSEAEYKFCHPLDAQRVNEIHKLNDGYLKVLVEKHPNVEWLVDSFGKAALFIAAQKKILEFMHQQNMRTAQYFRDDSVVQIVKSSARLFR